MTKLGNQFRLLVFLFYIAAGSLGQKNHYCVIHRDLYVQVMKWKEQLVCWMFVIDDM